MLNSVKNVLADTIGPMLRRPPALQLAALCHRDTPQGREVLLVTSSHGRWILPKGWPIDGLDGGETALQEAWEEAGVKKGKVGKKPIGTFQTIKRFDSGQEIPCETTVYAVKVKDVANDYPEADKRKRQWVPVEKATDIVDEDGLRDLLNAF